MDNYERAYRPTDDRRRCAERASPKRRRG